MNAEAIKFGCVYRHRVKCCVYTVVQVIGRNTQYFRVRGVGKDRVPYNFVKPEDLSEAPKDEIQWFLKTQFEFEEAKKRTVKKRI